MSACRKGTCPFIGASPSPGRAVRGCAFHSSAALRNALAPLLSPTRQRRQSAQSQSGGPGRGLSGAQFVRDGPGRFPGGGGRTAPWLFSAEAPQDIKKRSPRSRRRCRPAPPAGNLLRRRRGGRGESRQSGGRKTDIHGLGLTGGARSGGRGKKQARRALKARPDRREEKKEKAGGGLLSRLEAVPSALGRLTSVFGTGTGISAPPWPPA